LPLKIIGDGPDKKHLLKTARPNIEFLGRVPDQGLAKHLSECRALIFPGEEDFGIVPLEAMSAGRPVIAYKAGGAEETVSDGESGVFFEKQTSDFVVQAVKRFQFQTFNKNKIREHAERFDKKVFEQKIQSFVEHKYNERLR
jgi:glycosyltransferase involved in cell wall biosynthesis